MKALDKIEGSLKKMVGSDGAYVMFVTIPVKGGGESVQVRSHGPTTRIIGTFKFGSEYIQSLLSAAGKNFRDKA